MDESTRKALEEKFIESVNSRKKDQRLEEAKNCLMKEYGYKEEVIDKVLSFFESVNSREEEEQRWDEAKNWLMKEHGYKEGKADEVIGDILINNDYELHLPPGGCIFTILIAITSTLSLYFVM